MNETMEKIQVKRPRKLNFNAPLLSTRRAANGTGFDNITSVSDCKDCSSNGIPFCWEQAPGKPKNVEGNTKLENDAETPRPKPPPCQWRPSTKETYHDHYHDVHDDGCDADVDDYDDDYDDNDDVFSDAMEVLSLTEAMDIVEKAEKFHGGGHSSDGLKSKSLDQPSDLDGLMNLESLEHSDEHFPSPNFIIERFLPDATALAAASSAMNMQSKTKQQQLPYLCNYTSDQSQAVIKRSFANSSKHCGLEMLLPWRMKHRLCSVKSPIKGMTTSSTIAPSKASSKRKNLFSSIVAPSGEWRCK